MDELDVLRRFNRSHTRRVGVLEESFLGTGRPLGPSRLLFEIGTGGTAIAELRRRLGLDSGYLSRMLRQLEAEDLVRLEPDPDDGRQRAVHLTGAGAREWRRLDDRSEELARRLVEPLTERQRSQLAAALETADRLLRVATLTFEAVDPSADDARDALARYFGELDDRFPSGFDPRIGSDDSGTEDESMRPPDGAFVLARSDRFTVGCGGVQRVDDRTGEIKRMWIHPDWRGLGLGPQLLARLEAIAAELGRARVVLDTNETLTEAVRMYERAGYETIERYNDNPYAQRWFAKDLLATDR